MHAFICSINKPAKVTGHSGETGDIMETFCLPSSSLCATVLGSSASSFTGEGQDLLITFRDPSGSPNDQRGQGCKPPAVRFWETSVHLM